MNGTGNSRFDSLVFDLGKVIIDFDPMRAIRKLEGRTPYRATELLAKMRETDLVNRFESGTLTSEEFYREISAHLQLGVSFEDFIPIWSDIFMDELILDASFFEQLKPRYRLVLLSNTNAMHAAFLRSRFPVLSVFDCQVLSHEVGAMKPSDRIYQAATEAARTTPGRMFYVDDIPAYVEAACRLGWVAIPFQGKDQLVREMQSLGIHPE
ncbi:MAG: HAD family phosphatase [Acidobacteriia bacterium]|nr:HAD family phosphatase [Terriglobia bacterium]